MIVTFQPNPCDPEQLMLPLTNPPVLWLKGTQISPVEASVHPLRVVPMVTPSNLIPANSSNPEKRLLSAQDKLGASKTDWQ